MAKFTLTNCPVYRVHFYIEEAIFGKKKEFELNIDYSDVPKKDSKRIIKLLSPFSIDKVYTHNLISLCYDLAILFNMNDENRSLIIKEKIGSKRKEYEKLYVVR